MIRSAVQKSSRELFLQISDRPKVASVQHLAEPSVVHFAEAEPSVMPTESDLRSLKKLPKFTGVFYQWFTSKQSPWQLTKKRLFSESQSSIN